MIVGGVIAGFGLQNPNRVDEQIAPRAAPAGECARCAGDGHDGHRPSRGGRGGLGLDAESRPPP